VARALLVPVKAFSLAKHRLAGRLGPFERAALARSLAAGVLNARGAMDAYVACDDEAVASFASSLGAFVLWTAGLGLSGAVSAAVAHLGAAGIDLVVVAHGDLPFVAALDSFGEEGTVTLAPDRSERGTNVAAVPARAGFRFSYGPGSFERHRAEANRLGLTCSVVRDWRLAVDVDHPSDLALLASSPLAALAALEEGEAGVGFEKEQEA
jgi:2-phospho-L-lactate guanylyltransferase